MGFLIDTDIWVAVERGSLAIADIHAVTGADPMFLSPVNVAELQMGIELVEDENTRRKALASMRRLRRKPLLRIDHRTGEVFGRLAGGLRKQGRGEEFRVMDLWLAAQAVQRNFKLLTFNERHFKDVPDLKLIVLRHP
ncbi:MAG: PIN domain-containing protein [Verrucomicrobiales bacterium]|nr:PIN domain-containing protein [Verrucomicrobiales bacterium]